MCILICRVYYFKLGSTSSLNRNLLRVHADTRIRHYSHLPPFIVFWYISVCHHKQRPTRQSLKLPEASLKWQAFQPDLSLWKEVKIARSRLRRVWCVWKHQSTMPGKLLLYKQWPSARILSNTRTHFFPPPMFHNVSGELHAMVGVPPMGMSYLSITSWIVLQY
jgi:hypothetical protein